MKSNYTLIISCILLVIATAFLFTGLHNIDLSFNFINQHVQDCSFNGCYSIADRYTQGIDMVYVSYALMVLNIFIIWSANYEY